MWLITPTLRSPQGLIEFIPELGALIGELNDVLANIDVDETGEGDIVSVDSIAPKWPSSSPH